MSFACYLDHVSKLFSAKSVMALKSIPQTMNWSRYLSAKFDETGWLAGISDRGNGALPKQAAKRNKLTGLFVGN